MVTRHLQGYRSGLLHGLAHFSAAAAYRTSAKRCAKADPSGSGSAPCTSLSAAKISPLSLVFLGEGFLIRMTLVSNRPTLTFECRGTQLLGGSCRESSYFNLHVQECRFDDDAKILQTNRIRLPGQWLRNMRGPVQSELCRIRPDYDTTWFYRPKFNITACESHCDAYALRLTM